MLPTLPYAARNISTGTDEQRRERTGGKWSESTETLNELEYGTNNHIALPRPLDERVFPSLSAGPENRILMNFECDRRRRTTRLTLNGQALYTFASLYENPSSKAGHFTQLRNKDGKVLATHIVSSNETKQMVKLGESAPVSRKAWLSQCGILSANCGKFQLGERWFKWRTVNDSGRVSVILRDHSIKSTPTVARFNCIHRIEAASILAEAPNRRPTPRQPSRGQAGGSDDENPRARQTRSWRAHLELNPDYRDVWDHAVFSLIVLECLKGGRRVPPLEYEDESGSNVSYLANLIGLFAHTA